jgi:type I restriction enzyme M protein
MVDRAIDDYEFLGRLEELNKELKILNADARELEEKVTNNIAQLLQSENA